MGRKLDLSSLTAEEAEHVRQVVQRDMQLRKTEEDRLKELRQELEEEKRRCVLLSRQRTFNQRCCMRCCSPFTFLLAPRYTCLACRYNVCRHCCCYTRAPNGWLCSACQRTRLLKTRSLEWFYSSVKRRFKRFGSDKVLKILNRRLTSPWHHQGGTSGGCTESADNESSVYESDSTFYRHSEEHSMADTTSVARRVAEEALDEAIAKSESQTLNQQKLKEAQYLQDNRGELVEELTTAIVQKIIRRRRETPETQPDWPSEGNSKASSPSSPGARILSSPGSRGSLNTSLWRSQSALALHTGGISEHEGKAKQGRTFSLDCTQGLTKEGAAGPGLPSWKSVDRLDNSSASVLQSPDGNWITMQSTQLSRPSLLTKRKSLAFTALEEESGTVSAYDALCSDTEPDADAAWAAALLQFRHRVSSNNALDDVRSTSLHSPAETTAEKSQTDSDQDARVLRCDHEQDTVLTRPGPRQHRRSSVPDGTGSSEEESEISRAKRTRRKRRSQRGHPEEEGFIMSSSEDCNRMLRDVLMHHRLNKQAASEVMNDQHQDDTSDGATPDAGGSCAVTPSASEDRLLIGSSDPQLTNPFEGKMDEMKDGLDKKIELEGEGNAKREKKRQVGTDALWDVEVEEGQDKMEHGKEHHEGKKHLGVRKNETELVSQEEESPDCSGPGEGNTATPAGNIHKKTQGLDRESVNSGMRNDHFHNEIIEETTKKQSGTKREKTAGIPQEKSLDQESESAGGTKEHEESEADDIGSEVRTRSPSVMASWRNERTSEEEQVENAEADGQPGSPEREQVKEQTSEVETLKEQKSQSGLKLEKQGEAAAEGGEEGDKRREAERRGNQEHTAAAAPPAKSEENEGVLGRWKETVKHGCDDLSSTRSEEKDAEYERMIESIVQTLNNMEREIEADLHDIRSDTTTEQVDEAEEIGGKQKEENKMPQFVEMEGNVEIKQDHEGVSVGRPFQVRVMGKEHKPNGDLTTEEKSCIMKAEECKDHTFKENLDSDLSGLGEFLTPEEIYKKYSAASLRSITTEVLKVLNTTEDLIRGTMGDGLSQSEPQDRPTLPPVQSKRLDEQLSHVEENVYVAAGDTFGLEAELEELAERARGISGDTTEGELAHLEEQVASAAAQVQQAEIQVTDIAARIAALKNAGLNVAPQTRVTKLQTIDSCRQHRRRLPAPPVKEKKA